MRLSRLAPLPLALALAACAGLPAAQAPQPDASATVPADDSLDATAWFQKAIERELISIEVYRAAGEHLAAALQDPDWDALVPADRAAAGPAHGLPPAIIVDVDETVLDNSPHQVRQIRARTEFDPGTWNSWVEERAATPLPGALDFLQHAAAQGVTVYYVSNRTVAQGPATVANLRATGFPIADDGQFLGKGTVVHGCAGTGSDKSCRRQLVGRGHRVVMQFGDQLGDFVEPAANTLDGRRAAVAPHLGWVGERWWVLPNPVYGSWESALSGDADSPEARRAAKEAALDDGVSH
ncbi:MAG TPA: HAD family acid phosphatase [Xanthomonadaceae bacterium]|nr:HAD family acid phosphatase [Xanthomonadaceae bacterium]